MIKSIGHVVQFTSFKSDSVKALEINASAPESYPAM